MLRPKKNSYKEFDNEKNSAREFPIEVPQYRHRKCGA